MSSQVKTLELADAIEESKYAHLFSSLPQKI